MREQKEIIELLSALKEQLFIVNNKMISMEDSIDYPDETYKECLLLLTHIITVKGIYNGTVEANEIDHIIADIDNICNKYLNKQFQIQMPLN